MRYDKEPRRLGRIAQTAAGLILAVPGAAGMLYAVGDSAVTTAKTQFSDTPASDHQARADEGHAATSRIMGRDLPIFVASLYPTVLGVGILEGKPWKRRPNKPSRRPSK